MSTVKKPMYHHLARVGTGLKDTSNSHEFYNQLMNLKPNQVMTAKHMVSQAMGKQPDHFHPRYEHTLEKHEIKAFRKAGIRHFESGHKLAELYRQSHAKGGGLGSAIKTGLTKVVNGIKVVGKQALKYGKQAAKWAAAHPDELKKIGEAISSGVDIIKQMTSKPEKIDFTRDVSTSSEDEKRPTKQKAGSITVRTKYTL